MKNRIRHWVLQHIERTAGAVFLWAATQDARRYGLGWNTDMAMLRRLARRELDAIPESVEAFFLHQKTEQKILIERLGRRYDLGLALNEAANRALAEKKEAERAVDPGMNLTSRQVAALDFQKQYLQRLIEKQ